MICTINIQDFIKNLGDDWNYTLIGDLIYYYYYYYFENEWIFDVVSLVEIIIVKKCKNLKCVYRKKKKKKKKKKSTIDLVSTGFGRSKKYVVSS